MYRTDLRSGGVVKRFVSYNILSSWPFSLNDFEFTFLSSCVTVKLSIVTGLPYGNPVGKRVKFSRFLFFLLFFSVSGKVFPVTPLLSGVFAHRVF